MTISELIKELEKLKAIHGDKKCVLESDDMAGYYCLANTAKIITTDDKDNMFFGSVENGEYILID